MDTHIFCNTGSGDLLICSCMTWDENSLVVNKRGQEKNFLLECSWLGGSRGGEKDQWYQENISVC